VANPDSVQAGVSPRSGQVVLRWTGGRFGEESVEMIGSRYRRITNASCRADGVRRRPDLQRAQRQHQHAFDALEQLPVIAIRCVAAAGIALQGDSMHRAIGGLRCSRVLTRQKHLRERLHLKRNQAQQNNADSGCAKPVHHEEVKAHCEPNKGLRIASQRHRTHARRSRVRADLGPGSQRRHGWAAANPAAPRAPALAGAF
jgi:hypothetical protein